MFRFVYKCINFIVLTVFTISSLPFLSSSFTIIDITLFSLIPWNMLWFLCLGSRIFLFACFLNFFIHYCNKYCLSFIKKEILPSRAAIRYRLYCLILSSIILNLFFLFYFYFYFLFLILSAVFSEILYSCSLYLWHSHFKI